MGKNKINGGGWFWESAPTNEKLSDSPNEQSTATSVAAAPVVASTEKKSFFSNFSWPSFTNTKSQQQPYQPSQTGGKKRKSKKAKKTKKTKTNKSRK